MGATSLVNVGVCRASATEALPSTKTPTNPTTVEPTFMPPPRTGLYKGACPPFSTSYRDDWGQSKLQKLRHRSSFRKLPCPSSSPPEGENGGLAPVTTVRARLQNR